MNATTTRRRSTRRSFLALAPAALAPAVLPIAAHGATPAPVTAPAPADAWTPWTAEQAIAHIVEIMGPEEALDRLLLKGRFQWVDDELDAAEREGRAPGSPPAR